MDDIEQEAGKELVQKDSDFINLTLIFGVSVVISTLIAQTVLLYLSQRKIERAEREVTAIGIAILSFSRDMGVHPVYQRGVDVIDDDSPEVALLFGPGELPWIDPENTAWVGQFYDTFESQLVRNEPQYPTEGSIGWKGPYLKFPVGEDPWGNRYVCNIASLNHRSNSAVWVLSAGPNRILETDLNQPIELASLRGDDIGIRIK